MPRSFLLRKAHLNTLATLLVLLAGAAIQKWGDSTSVLPVVSPSPESGISVTSVVDGDTLKVKIKGKNETVRLLGVDTPETVDPRKSVQCFGREAAQKTKEVAEGQTVRLEADATQADRDIYNRLLRYIYLPDGQSLNLLLISEGFAHEYTYNHQPYLYQSLYQQAERSAREQQKGLWSPASCNGNP